MKDDLQHEVILFSKYSFGGPRQTAFLLWLRTTAQYVIDLRERKAKKLLVETLKDSPAIYLS